MLCGVLRSAPTASLTLENVGFPVLRASAFDRYGAVDGFLTPNVADTRNPLVVVLHNGCISSEAGGLTSDGSSERYVVNLLEEEPAMPSAQRMLEILAENPVAQAKFFIISMRLFLEHVLGVMPFDEQLRANGSRAGVVYPDGAAAEFVGGAFPAIQQLHGPIEEQARLSCHPHIVLHFVLKAETAEAKRLLRNWQEKTLLAVESIMSSCAGAARLQFEPTPFRDDIDLLPQPYTAKWQEEDRFDGGPEEDVREPGKKRLLISVVPPLVDHHVRRHLAGETAASFEETKKRVNVKQLPLTGCLDASWLVSHIIVCPSLALPDVTVASARRRVLRQKSAA